MNHRSYTTAALTTFTRIMVKDPFNLGSLKNEQGQCFWSHLMEEQRERIQIRRKGREGSCFYKQVLKKNEINHLYLESIDPYTQGKRPKSKGRPDAWE